MNHDEIEELIRRCLFLAINRGDAIGPKPHLYSYVVGDVGICTGEYRRAKPSRWDNSDAALHVQVCGGKVLGAIRVDGKWVNEDKWLQATGAAHALDLLRREMLLDALADV